ncbi:MAG: FG-GAP-like repeat-containing protein, partial [Bacteroidales bacterium]|nr:FG-GAP-like repeat-containing protein [Bacteroidales bacterium]
MKCFYTSFLLSFFFVAFVHGQSRVITLSQPQSNIANTYIARDTVVLDTGFEFTASGEQELKAWVDNDMLLPTDYIPSGSLPGYDRQLNTSLSVGTIEGSPEVSPSGAATYTIPIEVTPGTGGIQPSVSIHYNSQGGNGTLGLGWSVTGFSVIKRIGKTHLYDGVTEEVKMDDTDNLSLDGQRLIRISGNNLQSGTKYRTEAESFQDITVKTVNGKLCIEIKDKAGKVYEYGTTAGSNIQLNQNSTSSTKVPAIWLLSKVTDINGNYMEYVYDMKEPGEFFLKRIDYTGNAGAGIAPYAKVEFFYETRSDVQSYYSFQGNQSKSTLLLYKIESSFKGELLRVYNLKYTLDRRWTKLTEIEECNKNGEKYNSTLIRWDSKLKNFGPYFEFSLPWAGKAKKGFTHYIADFNGDGINDILYIEGRTNGGKYYDSGDWGRLFLGSVYYRETTPNAPATKRFQVEYLQADSFQLEGSTYLTGDFNGDGYIDLVNVNRGTEHTHYSFMLFDGQKFSAPTAYGRVDSSKDYYDQYVGDFNGDGKDELLVNEGMFDYTGKKLADRGRILFNTRDDDLKDAIKVSGRSPALDINGNGRNNIIHIDSFGELDIYEYDPENLTFKLIKFIKRAIPFEDTNLRFGDFNGDGLTDILVTRKASESTFCFQFLYSKGDGNFEFYPSDYQDSIPGLEGMSRAKEILIGDINRDGKSDIVFTCEDGVVSRSVSTGQGFVSLGDVSGASYPGAPEWHEHIYCIDLFANGKSELCVMNAGVGRVYSISEEDNFEVTAIRNGFNQSTEFTYCPLPLRSIFPIGNFYKDGSRSSYPLNSTLYPLYVVAKMKNRDFEGNPLLCSEFCYEDMKTHVLGKGSLGFGKITVRDTVRHKSNSTEYTVYPNYRVALSESVVLSNNDTMSVTKSEPYYYEFGDNRYFEGVGKTTEKNHLTGLTQTVEYNYLDNGVLQDGNVVSSVAKKGELSTTTVNKWISVNNPFKNLLSESSITNSGGSGQDFVRKKRHYYDASGRDTSFIDYYGTEKAVRTSFADIDDLGNFRVTTTSAAGCPFTRNERDYDEFGRVVIREKDVSDNETTYEYDPFTLNITRKTTPDGLSTVFSYNAWGNLLSESTPEHITTEYRQSWNIDYPSLYKQTVTRSDMEGAGLTIYDHSGREIATETPGLNGTVYTATTYYADGTIQSKSDPYFRSEEPSGVFYFYDPFGRVQVVSDHNRLTGYFYEGLTTRTHHPDGTETSVTLNSSGLTAYSTDAKGGKVVYSYNSLGKPDTITSNGSKTFIGYDYRGYQSSLKDPNLGKAITYEYDAYGRLVKEKNGRDSITTYKYDELGRIKEENGPEGKFEYIYVTSGNGKNQLESIKRNDVTVQKYAYNEYGNAITETEIFENNSYVNRYAYDNFQRLKEYTSPSGLTLAYTYNNNSFLTEIKDKANNSTLWTLNKMNARGLVTQSTFGNGLQRHTSYDEYDLLSSLALKNGSATIDSVSYSFDPSSGNLSSRHDFHNAAGGALYETFGYDELRRLTSISRSGTAETDSISYYANGNIRRKYDVGEYLYDDGKHAVSGIKDPAAGYAPEPLRLEFNSTNHVTGIEVPNSNPFRKTVFTYGYDDERRKMQYYENNALKRTRYYFGSYEKEETPAGIKHYDYIDLPDGMIIYEKSGNSSAFRYVHTDHLGSIRTVTGPSKELLARYYYNAWGKRSVTYLKNGTEAETRGYTGHEHLDEFGLINMNARLYDPVLGRLLGMDPNIQLPDYTQNFNRYSYAL